MLDAGRELLKKNDHAAVLDQLALMTFGWMPTILVLHLQHVGHAQKALQNLAKAKRVCFEGQEDDFNDLTKAVHNSVSGASKLLHFTNPNVFPIYDSKIRKYWFEGRPGKMGRIKRYYTYAKELRDLRKAPGFKAFYQAYSKAYKERLRRYSIKPHGINCIRAIESAAFELGGTL